MPRRRCRVDANHGDVKGWLETLGWFVVDTHEAPQYKAMRGFSDLLAVCPEATVFVEVKARKAEKLTADESEFRQNVLRAGGKYAVAVTFADVEFMTRAYWPGRMR